MNHLQQVQRAVDYIEAHLAEELAVEAIARVAGFSKWHFQMVFSAAVGDTLKEYIRKRRLTAAIHALGEPDRRVIDIALDAGFESQEAFTRAFKAMFGKTPGECRAEGARSVMARNKLRISMEYLDHLYGGINMQPVIKQIAEKKVVGMGARFISALSPDANNQKVIGELWSRYMPSRLEVPERANTADLGIVVCLSEEEQKAHPHEMFYLAGAEVTSATHLPEGMAVLTVPAGKYAVFTHKGHITKISMTMRFIYGSWLPKSDQRLRLAPEIEVYDERFRHDSEESEMDVYIPIE